jgi:hypothetical protein
LNNRKPPSTDLFPSSLLYESQKVLGDQFTKLPRKIQTGYTLVFWNHSGLIRHNTHNRRTDSFPMDNKEVSRYFTDPRDFRAINDNGYYLKPKNTRHGVIEGQYVVLLKDEPGATHCEPTKWVIKTIEAFQGWAEVGVIGTKNGYILDSEVKRFIDAWFARPELELAEQRGMVNSKGASAKEIAYYYGGAIQRNLSKVTKRVNINEQIKINIESLLTHKEQLNYSQGALSQHNTEALVKGSIQWSKVLDKLSKIEGRGERGEEHRGNVRALGGVKVKNIHSKSLKSLSMKDFTSNSINERLVEINKLLATAREEKSATIPIFYNEAKTGRYTAKNATLQGFHRSVRYAALKGCYEYDINAAHQNILIQLLDQKNIDFPELEVVRDYVKDKQGIRVELSEALVTTIETVKDIINALTYGAQLVRNKKQAIYDICEGDEVLIERVITNQWFNQLAKTFLIAHKHLVGDKKILKNAVGIKSESLNGKAEAMAHILQGCERLVLDALIKHSKPKNVALLIHDCIVYYTPKNPSDLSRIVFENTGFDLEFSEAPY